jgi:5-methylcytosine-specific restriction endonuclease McrA
MRSRVHLKTQQCQDCGVTFQNSYTKPRCGGVWTKTGCAWKNRQKYKYTEGMNRWYRDRLDPVQQERRNARSRKSYAKHRQRANEYSRRWYKEHPEQARIIWNRRRMREVNAPGEHTLEDWNVTRQLFGNSCYACGRSDVFLDKDHIIPVSKGGTNNKDNIAPLCKRCNNSKKDKLWVPACNVLTRSPQFAKWT